MKGRRASRKDRKRQSRRGLKENGESWRKGTWAGKSRGTAEGHLGRKRSRGIKKGMVLEPIGGQGKDEG